MEREYLNGLPSSASFASLILSPLVLSVHLSAASSVFYTGWGANHRANQKLEVQMCRKWRCENTDRYECMFERVIFRLLKKRCLMICLDLKELASHSYQHRSPQLLARLLRKEFWMFTLPYKARISGQNWGKTIKWKHRTYVFSTMFKPKTDKWETGLEDFSGLYLQKQDIFGTIVIFVDLQISSDY